MRLNVIAELKSEEAQTLLASPRDGQHHEVRVDCSPVADASAGYMVRSSLAERDHDV